ncbi:MAG: histidine kinase [Proteobacteria bacterium]|nr:MAG: histidine kinase [Pseudomonadota bacterium]
MNRHSLSVKITFIFTISFLLVCILFVLLYRFQIQRNIDLMQQRQFQSMNYLLQLYRNNTTPKDLEAYFNYFGFKKIENPSLISSIILDGEKLFFRKTLTGNFASILYNDRYYLHVNSIIKNQEFVFETEDDKNSTDHLWIGFFLAMGVLITTYMSIINSFKPLQKLSQNIRRFASGDMEVEYKSDNEDEIAKVANEFDKAVKKIRHLIKSRQLFLRTIMHELKTPIGKGRIVSEMVENDLQKKRLISIFERLDLLLNEFSKIEQLVSKSHKLNIQEYPISSVLEQSIDMLMLDYDQTKKCVKVKLKNEDEILRADFELLSLAIKNLLDNALKYSKDNCVYVGSVEGGLRFSNKGDPLSRKIEYYYEAFINDKNSKGMGLGLYIVKNILEYHGYELAYFYDEGMHNFDILWKKL